MKKLLLAFLSFALLPAQICAAQLVRVPIPFPSISSQYSPLIQANIAPNLPTVNVCHSPANQVPCTNYAQTYTSLGASCPNGAQDTPDPQPSDCQATGDAEGNLGFWVNPGQYDYTVCIQNTVTCLGPYTVTAAGGAGSILFQTNGVTNANQAKQNLHSSDGTVTLTDDGSGNINLQSSSNPFTTSGNNLVFGGMGLGFGFTGSASGQTSATPNQVRVVRTLIPYSITVKDIVFDIGTGGYVNLVLGFGLYSMDGNTKILEGVLTASSTSTGTFKISLGSPVTVPAGSYYYAYASNQNANVGGANSLATNFLGNDLNKTYTRLGTAANSLGASSMPATLGAITPASFNTWAAIFEN